MENVPELRKFDVFEKFKNNLTDKGYYVSYKIVNCNEYGIPQKRRRLVLLASKFGNIDLIKPSCSKKQKNVFDVLKNLPPLQSGEINKKDPLHRCAKLSSINIKRIKQSKQGVLGEIGIKICYQNVIKGKQEKHIALYMVI